MPIEVFCPNPACAKRHWVKSKYAGQRGRCPACKDWMYVPAAPPPAPAPAEGPAFGWAAGLLLLLGVVGLGLAAAAPSLPQPTFSATGDHAALAASVQARGLHAEATHLVTGIPLLACFLPMGALLFGALYRGTNGLSLACTYLAVLLASGMAFLALVQFQAEAQALAGLHEWVEKAREAGKHGEVTYSMGCYLHAALTGTMVAAGAFLLAAFCLHRAVWARVLALLGLGLPLAAGSVWLYREELARLGLLPG